MKAVCWLLLAGAFQVSAAESFTYWIQPCAGPEPGCQSADEQLVRWALQSWERASGGALKLMASPEARARVRVHFVSAREGLYGETRGVARDPHLGADVYIRPALDGLGPDIRALGTRDGLFRDTIVYLTALHELGHALGLAHTRGYEDIMYNFAYGGDIVEYFSRYRRRLTARESISSVSGLSDEDVRRVRIIYRAEAER